MNESAIAAGQQSLMENAEQARKRALMVNFDQVPITEFHQQIKPTYGSPNGEEGQSAQIDCEELGKLTLAQKAQHSHWGIRKDAYTEI